jgi:phosphatidylglycerol---prolipoprotein diacylglyceryl transferase
LMMLLCFVGSMLLLQKCLLENKKDPSLAEPMITYAAIGGIIGARVFSILSDTEHLIEDPIGVIFGSAGFVFYGGFIGGVLGVVLLLRMKSQRVSEYFNIVAAPLAFGYAIGRLGCQLSGDGDYGIESSLPWAMNFSLGVVPTDLNVHPTPLYESIFSMCLAVILRHVSIRNFFSTNGRLFGLYLVCSGLLRFLVEFIRIEPVLIGSLSQAQVISIPLFIIGLFFISGRLCES